MKKIIALVISALMILAVLAGCGADNKNNTTDTKSVAENDTAKKLDVVTTIFPEYDWVRAIAGDRADITMLLDNGVDLHSYQPTADDIVKISNCDIFIYVGGESDEWVEDVLAEAKNENMIAINLLETLGDTIKEEEVIEGMEAEEEEAEGEEEGEEEVEYDEHVWLSLKNASVLCQTIAEKLGELDVANKDLYKANADSYIGELESLDKEFESAVKDASVKTLLFADRFPFRYLVDDYGLKYYAAFVGCSAETEASFETIAFLAGKVDELKLGAIMQIESADGTIARTVKETAKTGADVTILTMDSMQSTTSRDVESGATYLNIMKGNLETLKAAIK